MNSNLQLLLYTNVARYLFLYLESDASSGIEVMNTSQRAKYRRTRKGEQKYSVMHQNVTQLTLATKIG